MMQTSKARKASGRGPRFARRAITLAAAIPVFMIPTLEWLPGIPKGLRPWLIIGGLGVAAVAFFLLDRHDRALEVLVEENERMKESIRKAEPEHLLYQIASSLFSEGAWRLTVYKKGHATKASLGDHLIRLSSAASDGDQRELSAPTIRILPSTMFEFSFRANLADTRSRRPVESGPAPEGVHTEAWEDWRDAIFGPHAVIDDRSTFRARKFVWYAAQDPDTQSIFALIAESADPDGIVVDYLDHAFTSAWLFFVSRASELRDAAAAS